MKKGYEYSNKKGCNTWKENFKSSHKGKAVEIYKNEYVYCRSYISKKEAENIAKDQWSILEQKLYVGV